jgi:hypothetical protein
MGASIVMAVSSRSSEAALFAKYVMEKSSSEKFL